VWVAGSIGPTGAFLEPLGDLPFEAARESFATQAAALAAGGADLLLVETMTDLDEARAAVLGARDATALPVAVTLTFEPHGRTMMGVTPEAALAAMADAGAVAVGANCGEGPAAVLPVVERLAAARPGFPLIAQPNAGRPEMERGVVTYSATAADFAQGAPALLAAGVRLIGSCCGSTPEFTRALAAAIAPAAG
jgi:5-methyltetrahydrofolate--homocysteine methyltransferase